MKTFERLDAGFFSSYISKLQSSGIGTDYDVEESNNQQNWIVITQAADKFIQHFELGNIESDSRIDLLAKGEKTEIMNFFIFFYTVFNLKNKPLCDEALEGIDDPTSKKILKKIEKNIFGTPVNTPDHSLKKNLSSGKKNTLQRIDSNESYGNELSQRNDSLVLGVVGKLEDSLEKCQKENQRLRLELMERKDAQEDIERVYKQSSRTVDELQSQLEIFKKEKADGMSFLGGEVTTKKHADLVEELKERLKILEEQIDDTEVRNSQLREEKANFQKQIRNLKIANAVHKDIKNYEEMNKALITQLEASRKESRQQEFKNDGMKTQLDLVTKSKNMLQEMLDKTKEDNEELEKSNKQIKRQLNEKNRIIEDLESTIKVIKSRQSEMEEEKKAPARRSSTMLVRSRSLLQEIGQLDFGSIPEDNENNTREELEQTKQELKLLKQDKTNTWETHIVPLQKTIDELKLEVSSLEQTIEDMKANLSKEQEKSTKQDEMLGIFRAKNSELQETLELREYELDRYINDPFKKLNDVIDAGNNGKSAILKKKHEEEVNLLYSIIIDSLSEEPDNNAFIRRKAEKQMSRFDNMADIIGRKTIKSANIRS